MNPRLMHPLSAKKVLEVWERGEGGEPHELGLAALSVALPEMSPDELAALPIGARDTLLLRLRESTLGSTLDGRAVCPECSAPADFALDVHDFTDYTADGALPANREHVLEVERGTVHFRLPTGADLALAAAARSVREARDILLERCVLEAVVDGATCAPSALPDEVVDQLSQEIESLDPMVELPLQLACAECGAEWLALLDIGSFFWTEISALAVPLMHDVATLARTYHWSEDHILSMSSVRRQHYLELGAS